MDEWEQVGGNCEKGRNWIIWKKLRIKMNTEYWERMEKIKKKGGWKIRDPDRMMIDEKFVV